MISSKLKKRALFTAICGMVTWSYVDVMAYNWPYKNATSSQQKIRQTVGAYRETNRFHNGIDIVPQDSADENVYSVVAGENNGLQPDGIRLGSIVYLHINALPEFDDPVNIGKTYPVGTLLGTLADSSGTHHIHFQEGPAGGPYLNPLNSISNFADTTKPTVDSFKVFRHGTNTEITDGVFYGRIDFRAKGYDAMDSGMGTTDNNGKVMPYKLGFKIHSYSIDAYALDKFTSDPTIRFNNAPKNQNVRLIHYSNVNADPEYWITNTSVDGATPANRWWNTEIKIGGDWDGEEIENAGINSESRFADGDYRVEILMGDNQENVNDLKEGASKKDFRIDNFRPYVEQVTIADTASPGTLLYDRQWSLDSATSKLTSFAPDTDNPLLPGHTYNITAYMSEYTNYASMMTQDGAAIPIISAVDYLDTHRSVYTGQITIPADITEGKVVPLVITDADTADNPLLKIDSGRTTDIDPALELTRDAAGNMQGIAGADTFHYLRIDAAPPIIRYNRHEERYQALNEGCAGRPTDLCGTEVEPINITYNNVPFSYTDIGSGLKDLIIYKETLEGQVFYSNTNMTQLVRTFASKGTMTIPDGKYVQTITDNLGHMPAEGLV